MRAVFRMWLSQPQRIARTDSNPYANGESNANPWIPDTYAYTIADARHIAESYAIANAHSRGKPLCLRDRKLRSLGRILWRDNQPGERPGQSDSREPVPQFSGAEYRHSNCG